MLLPIEYLRHIVQKQSKCDVIKQNESELTNIDFEIEPIIVFNFLLFLFVLSITKIAISLKPYVQF